MAISQVDLANERTSALASIEEIRCRANVRQMLEIPFFVHLKQHRLSQPEFHEFFCQYYSIVKTSYQMLAAGILSTAPEDTDAIEHLVRFLETESGGDPNHLAYYLRWAEHFGVSKADLTAAQPNKLSREFEETLMGFFSTSDSFIQKAAQVGLEDCAEVLIEGLNQGFKVYPMTTRANGYLMAHLLLENDEDGHSRWAIDSLASAPDLQSRLNEVEAVYRRVYEAFVGVFNGIYAAWTRPAHAIAK